MKIGSKLYLVMDSEKQIIAAFETYSSAAYFVDALMKSPLYTPDKYSIQEVTYMGV